MAKDHIGIVGTGLYLPDERMTAAEISEATEGYWAEEAVKEKLGIIEKVMPGEDDGTQAMGVRAAEDALERTGIDPEEIDLILGIGEEWKEYPLTTSSIYIQGQIGAKNAWAIDMQQRCCTTVAALKIAESMMLADDEINTAMIVGGYRNVDFVDYTDKPMSMMYNLGAGGGALIVKKNYGKNVLMGSHIMSDGSLARDAGVKYGGCKNPISCDNIDQAQKSLTIFNPEHMKERLNEISMENWMHCIDQSFEKAGIDKDDLGYLAVLHFKRSMHNYMLDLLNIEEDQSSYLSHYGHIGQIDQILSLRLGLEDNKIEDGTVISMIAAGIGYAWAANVIKWGELE
jgi:3-oxoacyl-[acyl-carrier-protein] synthase-3